LFGGCPCFAPSSMDPSAAALTRALSDWACVSNARGRRCHGTAASPSLSAPVERPGRIDRSGWVWVAGSDSGPQCGALHSCICRRAPLPDRLPVPIRHARCSGDREAALGPNRMPVATDARCRPAPAAHLLLRRGPFQKRSEVLAGPGLDTSRFRVRRNGVPESTVCDSLCGPLSAKTEGTWGLSWRAIAGETGVKRGG
jgi:hypothetical protein